MSFEKGYIPWNKGIKTTHHNRIKECLQCSNTFHPRPKDGIGVWRRRKFCSKQCSNKSKIGHICWRRGKKFGPMSLEWKLKISRANSGPSHWNWKDGQNQRSLLIRRSLEYREWRKSVFDRDNYTCQFCRIRGGILEADHIKPFSLFPELRLEISNGRTLCRSCHRKTDTYGEKAKRFVL